MNKAEKKLIWYSVLSVFVLLTVLLGMINGVNFTMAARDADAVTQRLASGRGDFTPDPSAGAFRPEDIGSLGPMGPDSPEIRASVRYFTCVVDAQGKVGLVSYNISAVSREDALKWAAGLVNETTGWTHGTYRYRVYTQGGLTYVTVIDQGRELLSAYRILIFSVCGTLLATLLSFFVLHLAGKKLFAPVAEADRKQKQFLARAEQEFKLPLTVISADTEILERRHGPSEQTSSIRRQVRSMDTLVRRLGTLAVHSPEDLTRTPFSLSELLKGCLDRNSHRFADSGLVLEQEIEPDIRLTGSPEALEQATEELIENALRYGRHRVSFRLYREKDRIRLTVENGTELPDGSAEAVFDRFTQLENRAEGAAGLGLAYVKSVVLAHNGRCSALVEAGQFRLQIDL